MTEFVYTNISGACSGVWVATSVAPNSSPKARARYNLNHSVRPIPSCRADKKTHAQTANCTQLPDVGETRMHRWRGEAPRMSWVHGLAGRSAAVAVMKHETGLIAAKDCSSLEWAGISRSLEPNMPLRPMSHLLFIHPNAQQSP